MKIVLVAGARPNFMKIAPLVWAMREQGGFQPFIVHTGQHYDDSMSRVFFDELEIPDPDVNLDVGSATHAVQTAQVMAALEPVLVEQRPDWVLVVGDVNSTLAAALTAVKLGIPVGHVEAGLRSGDRTMPEEINRLATDAIADVLFAPSLDAVENLRREGHPEARIAFVGNVMVDTLLHVRSGLDTETIVRHLGLQGDYVLVTLHRPSNVDDPAHLRAIVDAFDTVAREIPVVFPVHPRTRRLLKNTNAPHDRVTPTSRDAGSQAGLRFLEPRPYREFIALQNHARVVVTDSGGIQEESTVLGTPCLTFRDTTERPVTVTEGTNRIIGTDPVCLVDEVMSAIRGPRPEPGRPEGWDGSAGRRIVSALHERVSRGIAQNDCRPTISA